MNIHSFIFNWPGQLEKVLKTENQLLKISNTTVINSDIRVANPRWVNLDDAYFTEQFITLLSVFDENKCDALFHIQGDATYDNFEKLFSDAENAYKAYDWGIYAPNVDYTWYDSEKADVKSLALENTDSIRIVGCPDCTAWFIHSDIIKDFKKRKINMAPYTMGWGWDLVLPAISYLNKRVVLRDYAHTVLHPPGTNYNKEKAEKEMAAFFRNLPNDVCIAAQKVKFSKEDLAWYLFEGTTNS